MEIKPIAHIYTDFPEKFGVPRQSRRVPSLEGKIVFEPEFRTPDAIRGIEDFSHLWLIFDFSLAHREKFSPTVRPPRLGGNTHVGVFASRSPYRPNSIGLSSVELIRVAHDERSGDYLIVGGADLVDGTPIYDIKPYIPFTDCIENAKGGYADIHARHSLKVEIDKNFSDLFPKEKLSALLGVLADDPRVSYKEDENYEYGMSFAGYTVKFKVKNDILTVCDLSRQ
ncbi:MAG: tRNA (N6-threonylcarbamoyladenosine(37)-N6)-methyltransferase TrmO [Clostridia bacterium]|nr:tRNA (N6-threonylcarbamoyladenosine(37)-N6)-methyltransferase TrmO [Clostridia bacterium]